MVAALRGEPDAIILKFGGGVHSRASEEEIDPRECALGENFQLDQENRQFRPRDPFDLEGTAPNGLPIRGLGQLQKADGTLSTLVQAGDAVYSWSGSFSFVATVSPSARLIGRLEQNWQLDDILILTDLSLLEPVKQWDGTTFQDMPHNLTGDFIAKYCFVSNERVFFGNVISNGVATPHMLVGSKRGDNELLSVNDRPSSALAEDDPFFLLTPDLRPINGLVEGFQQIVMSSKEGSMWILSGESSKDFRIDELYPRSAASSDRSLAWVGNDILYGRQGRIESILATERFADVQADDITVPVADQVSSFTGWTTVYNSRLQRIYLFPEGQPEVWVYYKDLIGQEISPWSKWTTGHAFNFEQTAVMNMYDYADGLEYVFMGDASGNFYKMEGTPNQGDANSASIKATRLSRLFEAPGGAQAFNIEGWVDYRRNEAATLVLSFEFAGENVYTEAIQISIPAITNRPVYGGGSYYGGSYYGAPFAGRIAREKFSPPGRSNLFQVRATIEGTKFFEINQIGLRFQAAT